MFKIGDANNQKYVYLKSCNFSKQSETGQTL